MRALDLEYGCRWRVSDSGNLEMYKRVVRN